jgi:shikimate 5-dehydrogenase
MLIHQAAVAFEVWTAEPAPVQAMAQAIFDATSK